MSFKSDPYFKRGIQYIFIITAALPIFVSGLSLVTDHGLPQSIFWDNVALLLLCLACLLLYLFYRNQVDILYAILCIIIFCTISLQIEHVHEIQDFLGAFLLNSIFFALIITLGALIVSRRFSFALTLLYFVILLVFTFHTKHPFLVAHSYKIIIIFSGYILVINYFITSLKKIMRDLNQSNNIVKAQNSEIQIQNNELRMQSEEISVQRDSLEKQKEIIEKRNHDAIDNLLFAKSIQQAILPKEKHYKNYLPDSFILLFPKDAISGDFYWIQEKKGKIYIAAIDCTGHGASGALVSMIMYLNMNRVLGVLDDPTPSAILNKLDSILISEINQDNIDFNSRVGMDLSLVTIDIENLKMQFSGAINPLYFVRDSHLKEYKGSRHLLGIDATDIFNYFENTYIDIRPGDTIYMFSDGLPDQFGGPKGKKFGYTRFKHLLEQISNEDMETQRSLMIKFIEDWKGNLEQVDDILIIGIRF